MRKNHNKFLLAIAMFFSVILLSGCGTKLAAYNPHESVGKQINYTITGIEAGAGIMSSTQNAMKAYGLNNDKWQLPDQFNGCDDQYPWQIDQEPPADRGNRLDATLDVYKI
jgi:hypothetical protein